MSNKFYINELEVSITSRCTLACANCGFMVPHQVAPSHGDPVEEISKSLEVLYRLGVRIKSLAILGGEPTINGRLLELVILKISEIGIAERIEVVTNGLTPRGLGKTVLMNIDRLSVSVYGLGDYIIECYKLWLGFVAPHVELVFRRNNDGWDQWNGHHAVSILQARKMFENCWYRRHCTTVERGYIFVCSRIAKLGKDDEGLAITENTSCADVDAYLHPTDAFPSCLTCVPMMGLAKIPAGVQPDDRIHRLEKKAIEWLRVEIKKASELSHD